jgi:hypothetical protein
MTSLSGDNTGFSHSRSASILITLEKTVMVHLGRPFAARRTHGCNRHSLMAVLVGRTESPTEIHSFLIQSQRDAEKVSNNRDIHAARICHG